jgi:hypothetical protein
MFTGVDASKHINLYAVSRRLCGICGRLVNGNKLNGSLRHLMRFPIDSLVRVW